MKKVTYISVLALAFSVMAPSCKSFLEENPKDRYVTDNYYSGENEATAAVTAVYQDLYAIYQRRIILMNELPADDEKNGLGMPNTYLQDLEYLRHTSENQFAREMWQYSYVGISRANTAIQNIPAVVMDETLKNRLIGEAKFLRALYYFNLVRFYGGVPIVLTSESVEGAKIARNTVDEVYNQIISDLTSAEDVLPISYEASNIGRVTKGAAKILLGKVYLAHHDYQKGVDKLAEVIENESSYGYGLHDDFEDNWRVSTENGKEMVLSIEFMDPPGTGNSEMLMCAPKYSLAGSFSVLGLTSGNEADIPTIDLYSQFSDQDERKDATFRKNFVSLTDGKTYTSTIPLFVKYWEEGETNPSYSDCNIFILRYSDALLMYAEALNEVGSTDKAYTYLNRVRERAFNSTEYDYAGLTQDGFSKAVWQERRLELAFEGQRWFDLVRTGRFVERMKEHAAYEASVAESNKTQIAANLKDYMVLMPIPQREIDLNPLLTQNPGY